MLLVAIVAMMSSPLPINIQSRAPELNISPKRVGEVSPAHTELVGKFVPLAVTAAISPPVLPETPIAIVPVVAVDVAAVVCTIYTLAKTFPVTVKRLTGEAAVVKLVPHAAMALLTLRGT